MYLQSIEMRKQQGINLLEIDLKNIDEGMEIGTAIHPLTGEQIPVFITSYVRDDYGSGAVMGVPAHCDQDKAFAIKNNLAIQVVLDEENKTVV